MTRRRGMTVLVVLVLVAAVAGGLVIRNQPWRDGSRHGPLALHEAVLDLLADAGLSPEDAPRASYLLFAYLLGSIVLVVADAEQPGPLPSEAEWIAARQRALAGTPADAYARP